MKLQWYGVVIDLKQEEHRLHYNSKLKAVKHS